MFNRADKVIAKIEKKRKEKEDKGAEESDAAGDVEIEGLGTEQAVDQTSEDEDSDQD
jgi:RING finger protein 113A